MHACPCLCVCVCAHTKQRVLCFFFVGSLCTGWGGAACTTDTFSTCLACFWFPLSLSHTHKYTYTERRNNRKNASTRKLHAALSHTLSLSIYVAFSLASALALPLSSLLRNVCLCVCVFVCWQFVNVGVAASCVFIISCLAVPCASWSSQSQQKAAETTSESRRCVSNNKITITIFFVFSRLVHLQHQKSKEVGAKKRKTQSKKKAKKNLIRKLFRKQTSKTKCIKM